MYEFKKLRAITLSQTLLIMGVVFLVLFALLAVPFYTSCKQKIAITKVRTVYTQLVDASHRAFVSSMTNFNEFDTTLPIDKFAQMYFTSQLPVVKCCEENQSECWNSVQYMDLQKNKIVDKITHSVILNSGVVLGFSKDKNNLITIIADIDGKSGYNRLGRDIFVFYIYNNQQQPKLCSDEQYSKYLINNGIHFGGFDKCGIPHDVHSYKDLYGQDLEDGCNFKAKELSSGIGVGSACLALIKVSDWTIDKIYPW